MTKLQRLIEEKEKQLTQKSESLQTLQKKFTETDKEKSEELDKVYHTTIIAENVNNCLVASPCKCDHLSSLIA